MGRLLVEKEFLIWFSSFHFRRRRVGAVVADTGLLYSTSRPSAKDSRYGLSSQSMVVLLQCLYWVLSKPEGLHIACERSRVVTLLLSYCTSLAQSFRLA